MKIKSYFAATIAEAISNARKELGPDAMIVASRKTGPEAMHLGMYEVVLGIHEQRANATPSETPAKETPAAETKRAGKKLVEQLAPAAVSAVQPEAEASGKLTRLRRQVDTIRESVMRKKPVAGEGRIYESLAMSNAYRLLTSSGFGEELGDELMQAVKRRSKQNRADGNEDSTTVRAALGEEMHARLQVCPELGRPRANRRIVALVGPPGAGKTSMLVKLAVAHGLTGRRPMHIISMDTYRLGGSEQLRTYAAAMGTSFEAIETVAGLSQSLGEHQSKGLILLDTQGYGAADMETGSHLASFLSRHAEADVHLVLPAYLSPDDMDRVANRFRSFLPSKLIFTNLDDVSSTGPLIAQALRMDKPVSFLGTGQQVPEDLADASAEQLIKKFLGGERRSAAEPAA